MRIKSLILLCCLLISSNTLRGQIANDSLSLAEAIIRAARASRNLAASHENRLAVEQKIKSARATYWPSLALSGSYAHLSKVNEIVIDIPVGGPQTIQIAAENPYNSDLMLSWDVYTFGRRSASVGLARNEFEISRLDYDLNAKRLFDTVARAYYAAVFTGQALQVIKSEKERAARILKLVEDRFRQQLTPEFDLLQMQLRLEQYTSTELEFQNNNRNAGLNLARLLDIEANDLPPLSDDLDERPLEIDRSFDQSAYQENREEYLRALAATETARLARQSAKSSYFPNISLFADYNLRNGYQPDLDKLESTFSFGVNFRWLLFDGFSRKAELSRLNYLQKASRCLADDLKLLLPYQVENARLTLQTSESRIEVGQRSLAVAQKAMEIAQTRYDLGDISMIELLEAENRLSEAELGLLSLKFDYHMALIALKAAAGYYPELELLD